jgi:hypothetical protein
MSAGSQEEYYKKVEAAVKRATDVLVKHRLQPNKYRVHIRSTGLSSPSEPHTLTISTADGSVWVSEASFPFRCIEEIDPFGSDAFHNVVANRMTELVKKVRQSGGTL